MHVVLLRCLLRRAVCCHPLAKSECLLLAAAAAAAAAVAVAAAAVIVLWLLTPPSHNLEQALQLSSMFLQAQRSTAAALTNTTIANILPSASNGTDGISVAFAAGESAEVLR